MAGVWKKTLNYLGLVEDEEDFVDEYSDAQPAPVRQMRPQPVRDNLGRPTTAGRLGRG